LLYATVTGDFGSYISDLITEAMTNLGWLTPAPKIVDGREPSPDPVTFPTDKVGNVEEIKDFSAFKQIVTTYPSTLDLDNRIAGFRIPVKNFVISAEMTSEKIPTGATSISQDIMGYPKGIYLHSSDNNFYYSTEDSPFNMTTLLHQKRINIYSLALGRHVTIKYGSTVLYDDVMMNHPTYVDLPSSFDARKYNKVVFQPIGVDPDTGKAVTRYSLISTIGLQPSLTYFATKDTIVDTTSIITEAKVSMSIPYVTTNNKNTFKVGVFNSIDLAWSADALPKPTINQKYFGTPIIDPSNNKLAIPQKSILPDGYTYDPSKQEIKAPDGQVVTDPTTIPEFNPDPVVTPSPDGNVVIDGEGTDLPVPPGGITPPADGGGTGDGMTTGDPTNIEWDKLKAIPNIFTKKFPFSLPWDAKRFIDSVLGDIPEAKDIVVNLEEIGGVHIGMNITLPEFFDQFFDFTRVITLVIFDIGLIYGLYRLLGGAS